MPPRTAAAVAVAAVVVALHAWLLAGGVRAPGVQTERSAPARPVTMRVRAVVAKAPLEAPVARSAPALQVARAPTDGPRSPRPALVSPSATAAAAPVDTPAPASLPPPAAEAEAFRAVPTYATQLPPSIALQYRVRRGERQGQAEFQWVREGDAYRLSLQDDLSPRGVHGRASQGQVDEHGLAPERFAESRKQREVRATNFNRDAGQVSFSAATTSQPWQPGMQDRLSWWIQLAGIVQAAPQRFGAGQRIELPVVGTRGVSEVWVFEVQGQADVGGVAALHLVRQPTRLFDARVEAWLDPHHHHLPLRVSFTPVPRGEVLEMTLSTLRP